jgi:hypothetical protein
MIKKLVSVICLAGAIFFASSFSINTNSMNTLSEKEKNEGWQLLFDGQNIAGWHTYGESTANSAWKMAKGVLYLDTTKTDGKREGGDLVTDHEFENFHLKLDWKIGPGGNSGIIFLIHEDTSKFKRTYETGPEMQVLDNNGHPDAKIINHRAGDLYDLISSAKETVKPVGQWNKVEIEVNKGKLVFTLNGTKVVSTTMWDDNWNTMVANSKFKNMPGFAKFKKGRIALQDHGDPVWFKDIKIKAL